MCNLRQWPVRLSTWMDELRELHGWNLCRFTSHIVLAMRYRHVQGVVHTNGMSGLCVGFVYGATRCHTVLFVWSGQLLERGCFVVSDMSTRHGIQHRRSVAVHTVCWQHLHQY